jgi:ribose transport system substrate-binding protein
MFLSVDALTDPKVLARRLLMDCDSDSCRLAIVRHQLPRALVVLVTALFALACNNSSASQDPAPAASSGAATLGSASAEPAADPAILAYAQHQIDLAYAGTDRDPPTTAAKVPRGKKVWIISPSQIGESASVATNAAKEAGELVGWKMTLFDAKGDPAAFSSGIRQAIAAKADGIILHAIDCAWVKQALVEAQAAKVKVLAYYALDCDDPSVKGEPLYSGNVNFGSQFGDYATLTRAWGAVKADWVIVKTQGKAKAISFKEDELLVVKYIREGFEQELAKCTTCQVVKTVDFTIPDFGPKLQQKAQGALLQHPEANAIHVPYDTPMLLGIAGAVMESGRNDQLSVIAGEGFPSNVQLIRDNRGQDAANAFPAVWTGYAAVDSLNSVFNGQKPQDSGLGWKLIDRDHNLPAPGKGYEAARDFRTAYKKAWGVLK